LPLSRQPRGGGGGGGGGGKGGGEGGGEVDGAADAGVVVTRVETLEQRDVHQARRQVPGPGRADPVVPATHSTGRRRWGGR
jgi:hypothetical protein